jgi:hypothetical protein
MHGVKVLVDNKHFTNLKCVIQTINSIPSLVSYYRFDYSTDLDDLFYNGKASFATSVLLKQMKARYNFVDITNYRSILFQHLDESILKEKCPMQTFFISIQPTRRRIKTK